MSEEQSTDTKQSAGPKKDFATRLRNYGAVLVACTAVVVAGDTLYTKMKESQLAKDTVALLKSLTDRTQAPTNVAHFHLSYGRGSGINNPGEDEIRNAVKRVGAGELEFLILERSSVEYIQSKVNKDGKFYVEYRSDMAKKEKSILLFGCEQGVPEETLVRALLAYRKDQDTWTDICAWKRVPL